MARKSNRKLGGSLIAFANYLPTVSFAKCFSNRKAQSGAILTFVRLVKAIKNFFLVLFRYRRAIICHSKTIFV